MSCARILWICVFNAHIISIKHNRHTQYSFNKYQMKEYHIYPTLQRRECKYRKTNICTVAQLVKGTVLIEISSWLNSQEDWQPKCTGLPKRSICQYLPPSDYTSRPQSNLKFSFSCQHPTYLKIVNCDLTVHPFSNYPNSLCSFKTVSLRTELSLSALSLYGILKWG